MSAEEVTYPEVGATAVEPLPPGYHHLRRERLVGRGEECFGAAVQRLMTWGVHRGAGLRVDAEQPRAIVGSTVVLSLGVGPLRMRAPCRVVATVEEPRRGGFTYGTLPGHPERGEERFLVEWQADDAVVFAITASSRPASWWVRLAGPVGSAVQGNYTERYLRSLAARRP